MGTDAQKRAAFDAGIAEMNRREHGEFDGLIGQLHEDASQVLKDVISHLRGYLLDRYTDAQVRSLLREYEPRPGFRRMTPVPDAVVLSLDLLNSIYSSLRCEGDRLDVLILGNAGARDKKRQRGARRGGRQTADINRMDAAEWHARAIDKARKLLSSGKKPHEITSIVATTIGKSADVVRPVLQEAGIVGKRRAR